MKDRKRKYIAAILAVSGIYLLLLLLLYLSESRDPASSIKTFGDALWYSVVTLTTVGYGDLTPHTVFGHLIGGIFLILSMGLLVTLFGTAASFLTGEALPMMLLGFFRKKNWYYFCDFGPESDLMARDILDTDPGSVIIFGEQKDKEIEVPDYPCFFLNDVPARVVEKKKGIGKECLVFFMKENDIYRNMKASDIDKLPVKIYAHTTVGSERISERIHFFHSYDCCARQYWVEHLLGREEQLIVIIGFGSYGEAILERAIMMNILDPNQHIAYHVFGDATRFLQVHPLLDRVFSINRVSDTQDMLFFHETTWRVEQDLLKEADRIIVCDDLEENSWDIFWKLKHYFVTTGQISIRTNRKAVGIDCFGSAEEIYTCENILRTIQNKAAIALNDLYRQTDPDGFIEWDELDDLLKRSKIAVADHMIMKCRILLGDSHVSVLNRRTCERAYEKYERLRHNPVLLDRFRAIEHLRWLRYYTFYNWSKGNHRDDLLRTHPMMQSFEDLTEVQKESRDYSWELLHLIEKEL